MDKIKAADFPTGKATPGPQMKEIDDFRDQPYRPLDGCANCAGAGFVHPLGQNERPDYSQLIPCAEPGCLADQARAYKLGQMKESSGVLDRAQSFDNFVSSVPGVAKAYNLAMKIADGRDKFIWLLIYGGVGNGKSHLLNAIANRVMERGFPTRLVMMADLLAELRMSIESHQTDFKMKELKEIPHLLIDEYGLELGSDWEKEKIEELLAARWNRGLFTVVATNKDIEDLPPRLKSRFLDRVQSRAVLNEAEDYRLTRRKR